MNARTVSTLGDDRDVAVQWLDTVTGREFSARFGVITMPEDKPFVLEHGITDDECDEKLPSAMWDGGANGT